MKARLAFGVSFVLVVAAVGALIADDKAEKSSDAKDKCVAKCPISGEDISKDASIDYKGGKLYFCCMGCAGKFKDSVAKYQAKANEQLVMTGQFKQVGCPLTGGKVNPATKIKVAGVDVGFCCGGCQGKVKKATAEKQAEIVFVTGFDKAFALKKEEDKEKKDK
jgi:YHS domain-containing protein